MPMVVVVGPVQFRVPLNEAPLHHRYCEIARKRLAATRSPLISAWLLSSHKIKNGDTLLGIPSEGDMKKWALISVRVLTIAGFVICLLNVWILFMPGVGYAKQVYTVPNPNPIYREFLPITDRAENGFLLLSAFFLVIFVLTFFRKQLQGMPSH